MSISAPPAIHRQFLARCRPLDGSAQGTPAVPAQRKARREYESRVDVLQRLQPDHDRFRR
ncbi:hypothetical protein [Streptosporangium roseum]|uniref:hypothetical protein n=1 Tax=Streptosporangium roseum TaxID=2001 RepID=UPI0018CC6D90|nr:hypothetical protein [Streptosporangium roseum]